MFVSAPVGYEEDDDDLYQNEELYNHLNPDMGGEEAWELDPDSDASPFEQRAKMMTDISPEKDGGVLKKVLREGTGSVIKPDAFVTGEREWGREMGWRERVWVGGIGGGREDR